MRSKTKTTALHAWADTQPRYVITGGMNQKLRQFRGSRHEHEQQQQPWHMAHIHSHLPRHCAPQRKRPFCLLEQGVRKVSRVNRRAAPPLHPTSEKKRDGDRTSHPSGVHSAHSRFSTQTQAHQWYPCYSCDCLFLLPNWVSLHYCLEDVSNNDPAVTCSDSIGSRILSITRL